MKNISRTAPIFVTLVVFGLTLLPSIASASGYTIYTYDDRYGNLADFTFPYGRYAQALVNDAFANGKPCNSQSYCGSQLVTGDTLGVDPGNEYDTGSFSSGYPDGLYSGGGGNNPVFAGDYLQQTLNRLCLIVQAVDAPGAPADPTMTGSATYQETQSHYSGPGNDNTLMFTDAAHSGRIADGWDLMGAEDIYPILNDTRPDNYLSGLTCTSGAKPAQSLTLSTNTIQAGQSASLTWADNDFYEGAGQTCTVSSDNPASPFTLPAPISVPSSNSCLDGRFQSSPKNNTDPNQTSTLMGSYVQSGTYAGDPAYAYSCNNTDDPVVPHYPNCTTSGSSCHRGGPDNAIICSWSESCAVASSDKGTITVSPTKTTTYTYSCANANGTTVKSVTLNVTAGTLPDLTASNLQPSTATAGVPTTLSASFDNSNTASTSAGFPDVFRIDNDADHTSGVIALGANSPALAAGASDSENVQYTFPTAGTYYLQACANTDTSGNTSIPESDYTNNCTNGGTWTSITVTGSTGPTGTCSASPANAGVGSTVTWTAAASGGSGGYTYAWSGTNLTGKTGASVQTSYSTQGSYAGSVVITDSSGAMSGTITCSTDVTVGGGGNLSSCTVSNQSPNPGDTVTYSTSGGSGSFIWTPSDGVGSYGAGPSANRTFSAGDAGKTFGMSVTNGATTKGCPSVTVSGSVNECISGSASATITADSPRVTQGDSDTISWTATIPGTPGQTCTVDGPDLNGKNTSDDVITTPPSNANCQISGTSPANHPIVNTQSTYTITCPTKSASVTVDVVPKIQEF